MALRTVLSQSSRSINEGQVNFSGAQFALMRILIGMSIVTGCLLTPVKEGCQSGTSSTITSRQLSVPLATPLTANRHSTSCHCQSPAIDVMTIATARLHRFVPIAQSGIWLKPRTQDFNSRSALRAPTIAKICIATVNCWQLVNSLLTICAW